MDEATRATFALECLKLAHVNTYEPDAVVEAARKFLAFALDDDAAEKLAAVRKAVS